MGPLKQGQNVVKRRLQCWGLSDWLLHWNLMGLPRCHEMGLLVLLLTIVVPELGRESCFFVRVFIAEMVFVSLVKAGTCWVFSQLCL